MKIRPELPVAGLLGALLLAGCGETAPRDVPAADPPAATELPRAGTVFSAGSDAEPLPPDAVFFPDAFAADGKLEFRIQMLPGYYVYKDKISVQPLTTRVTLGDVAFGDSEMIVDEWFGEQEIFFTEAIGAADLDFAGAAVPSFDIELNYQGCKKDDLCYLPVSKVITVEYRAQVE